MSLVDCLCGDVRAGGNVRRVVPHALAVLPVRVDVRAMIAAGRCAPLLALVLAACGSTTPPASATSTTGSATPAPGPVAPASFDARDEEAHQAGQEALRCYESCLFNDEGDDETCRDSCGLAD